VALNEDDAWKIRRKEAKEAAFTSYNHQSMENYYFLKVVLRALTMENLFTDPLREPSLDANGERDNGGCGVGKPGCILTWDGYGRAMASADALFDVLQRQIPGDVVEVGVFKGGLMAYFQAMLIASGEADAGRKLWLVDSFKGLPPAVSSDACLTRRRHQATWVIVFGLVRCLMRCTLLFELGYDAIKGG
jgi:hypothetical protein